MIKILGCTSIRSDYDLLSSLYKKLNDDSNIDFRLVVSGAHLLDHFGHSIEQIKRDKFKILAEINTISDLDDSKKSRLKSASKLLESLIDPIEKFFPDIIIYSGDREDVIIYSMVGIYLDIPTIHFYSGDHAKDGYVDNPIRHATSKLSTAHFVSLEEHRKRLIALGEHPDRIFVIGSIALDRFTEFEPLSIEQIKSSFPVDQRKIKDCFGVLIFHPIGGEEEDSSGKFENTLKALIKQKIMTFVSYPNSDPNNNQIRSIIEKYKDSDNFIFFKNLDREVFLSIYKRASFIIGNSSSGIHEAASMPIPAINVGKRQTGRFAGENVKFISGNSVDQIVSTIKSVLSSEFQNSIKNLLNPYGDGNSADKAFKLIKNTDFKKMIQKIEDPLEVKSE